MCRRFRRLRRLAQQVVTVTRRLWRVCQCCGKVTADPRQDVVPLAAILSNTKAAGVQPGTPQRSRIQVCCHCFACTCFNGESGQEIYNEESLGCANNDKDDVPMGANGEVDAGKTVLDAIEQLTTVPDTNLQEVKLEQKYIEPRSYPGLPPTVQMLALSKSDSNGSLNSLCHESGTPQELNATSSSSDSSCSSHQTDDNAALRYYAGSPAQRTSNHSEVIHLPASRMDGILPSTSQTDNIVALRYLYPRLAQIRLMSRQSNDIVQMRVCSNSSRVELPTLSGQYVTSHTTSIQTDDIVALRYLYPRRSQIHRISSQTDDIVSMRLYRSLSHVQPTSSAICHGHPTTATGHTNIMMDYPRPFYLPHVSSQSRNPSQLLQRSSQTDDSVAMRFYPRPSQVQHISSQTDDMVAMRFHDEVSRIFDRRSEMDEITLTRCNSVPSGLFAVSSQTDDDVAMRYLSGPVRLLATSSQTDDNVAMRFYNDSLRLSGQIDVYTSMYHTVPADLSRISSQTDDIVAMRFLTEPPRIVYQSSQTDDLVAMRFYGEPLASISRTSQTDDYVAMRYYHQRLHSSSNSSQTDDSVAMRFYSVEDTPHFEPDIQQADPSIAPDMHRAGTANDVILPAPPQSKQRDQGKYPWRTTENPVPDTEDSFTSIEVRRRHWNVKEPKLSADDPGSAQVKSLLTLKFPLSALPVPPVTKPEDLTVEFAIVNEWYRIYPVEWTKIQNIARTRTGSVDLTILGEHNRQIALKTLDAETSVLESQLLIDCQGPFVVQLCASMVQGDERFLCMTYYTRRDLTQWLAKDRKRKYFKEQEAVWILAYIMGGVNFLHGNGILHLDIKPANILIDNKGYPVLGDFGSAMRIDNLTDCVAFTPAYAAPEVLGGHKPNRLSDLWSVACIYYEIIMKRVPYIGKFSMETELRVSLGVALEASSMSTESKDYLCSELKLVPRDRLGFGGACIVMRHVVFNSIDWSDIRERSRKLECPLFKVFRQIERAEFNRRNKPDPIPPDSIFYRPWSEYMKDIRPAVKPQAPSTSDNLGKSKYIRNIPNDTKGSELHGEASGGVNPEDNPTNHINTTPDARNSTQKHNDTSGTEGPSNTSGERRVRFILPETNIIPVVISEELINTRSSAEELKVRKEVFESGTVSHEDNTRPGDVPALFSGEEVTTARDENIHNCVDQT